MKNNYRLMVYFNFPNRVDTFCFQSSGDWLDMKHYIDNFIEKQCNFYGSDLHEIIGLIKE